MHCGPDVDALSEAVRAREAAEARMRRVIDQAPDAYVSVDASGAVTEWNAAATAVFGWTRQEVLGREMGALLLSSRRAALHRRHVQEIGATRASDLLGRHRGVPMSHRDGRLLRIDCVVWSVPEDDGSASLHTFLSDVTEQRAAADDLRRANDDLSQFSAAMAHDLRAPLTVIKGYAELLTGELERADPLLGVWADRVETAADRGIGLVDDLLGYLTVGRVRPASRPVDLTTLAEAVALEHRAPGRRPARIDVRRLPRVVGDAGLLTQLLGNLVGNAVKFGPTDREVEVVVDAVPGRHPWSVLVRVHDNGDPVEPADRERIFAMFQRGPAAEHVGGSGIGLAFCRRVAELHGGRMFLESPPDGGNRFCVELERSER
jgi:PAS domain S-box-containing protein